MVRHPIWKIRFTFYSSGVYICRIQEYRKWSIIGTRDHYRSGKTQSFGCRGSGFCLPWTNRQVCRQYYLLVRNDPTVLELDVRKWFWFNGSALQQLPIACPLAIIFSPSFGRYQPARFAR